eukprot:3584918-Prymnesium_polylepis.2
MFGEEDGTAGHQSSGRVHSSSTMQEEPRINEWCAPARAGAAARSDMAFACAHARSGCPTAD